MLITTIFFTSLLSPGPSNSVFLGKGFECRSTVIKVIFSLINPCYFLRSVHQDQPACSCCLILMYILTSAMAPFFGGVFCDVTIFPHQKQQSARFSPQIERRDLFLDESKIVPFGKEYNTVSYY